MPAWDDLRLFLACHRGGSATRAAKALDTTVSTVSRRLDRLEAELGTALFLRGNEGLVPTPAAERMLEAALEAERRTAEAFAAIAPTEGPIRGVVRLAATTDLANFILLPALGPVLAAHPELRVELVLGTELSDLSRRESDLAVRIGEPGADADLVVRTLRTEPLGLFASRGYLASRPASLPLGGHRFVEMGAGFESTGVRRWLAQRVPNPDVVLRANDFTTIRLAAAAGLGVAILPHAYAWITPGLVDITGAEALPSVPLYAVAHRATRRGAAVRVVWDFVVDLLTPRPDRDDPAALRAALAAAYHMSGWDTAANHNV